MAVIRPAHDVALVGASIFVHAHVPIDVHAPIDVGMTSTVIASRVMSATVMSAAVVTSCMTTTMVTSSVASTVVTSSVASTVAFRICGRDHAKAERCSDRKDERKLLQHFYFPPKATHRTVTICS